MHQKPLRDIRYFESVGAPQRGSPSPSYASELFTLPEGATALGQRIARKCEELGVSIGTADHLYLCFTPSLAEGATLQTDYATERWNKFFLHGLARTFNGRPSEERLSAINDATFGALEALAVHGKELLAELRAELVAKGSALRIVLRTKETKKYRVTVEQDVPVPPIESRVFVRIEERSTSRVVEAQVAKVRFHDDAPSLVDRLAIVDEVLTIHPRKSFRASLVTQAYELPLKVNLRAWFAA